MISKHEALIVFILGFATFIFTRRGEFFPTIQVAIIIAPIFILRFIRIQTTGRGIPLTLLGFLLSMNIALWNLFDAGNSLITLSFNIVRSSLLAVLYFLPYMIDRLLYPEFQNNKILSTLVFPVSVTALFFLSSLEGPFDGTAAKTIYADWPLFFQQLNSVTGLWGFTFILSWIASIINYSRENKFNWQKTKKPTYIFLSILLIIILFDGIKLSPLMNPKSQTVKVASIILIPEEKKVIPMNEIFEKKYVSPFHETISKIKSLTRMAVQNDAKIVAFQEFAITISEDDEPTLREEFKRIAGDNNVYLSISYAYFAKTGKGRNKNLLFDNHGKILIDYTKRYLLGIGSLGETRVFEKGAEAIQAVDTPYGKIAVSICRDMNFPSYMRQAAKENVDIMINPSYDYPKSLAPDYHHRSIEFGFSTIRPAYNGISYIGDYNGKILAQMDSGTTNTGILYGDVPTKGIKTIYGVVGDLLGWLCLTIVILFIIPVFRNMVLRFTK